MSDYEPADEEPKMPLLTGVPRGFNSRLTMTPQQIVAHAKGLGGQFPDIAIDDLTVGVVAMVMKTSCDALADLILSKSQKRDPMHIKLVQRLRARGFRMSITIEPMAPGEGEADTVFPLPTDAKDLEVLEITDNSSALCGVMGCGQPATHVVRSLGLNSGCWACTKHGEEIRAAIEKRTGA